MENTFGNELREFNCLYKEVDLSLIHICKEKFYTRVFNGGGWNYKHSICKPVSYTHLQEYLSKRIVDKGTIGFVTSNNGTHWEQELSLIHI